MKIVIAGGTGFLGHALAQALVADCHDVVVLTRDAARRRDAAGALRLVAWTPNGSAGAWAAEIDGAGAVVNLAGESIAAKRWSPAQKRRILQSRIAATRSLAAAIRAAATPPVAFIRGSAVGAYGPRGHELAPEDTAAGPDFLASVGSAWLA